jgi:gas vesicle protein
MANEKELNERFQALEKEKQLFFDLAYKSYNELASIADECKDREAAHRISEAITPLGMFIGRSEPRERPR